MTLFPPYKIAKLYLALLYKHITAIINKLNIVSLLKKNVLLNFSDFLIIQFNTHILCIFKLIMHSVGLALPLTYL